jgi:VWFA-related protein
LRDQAAALKKERDELKERAASLEKQLLERAQYEVKQQSPAVPLQKESVPDAVTYPSDLVVFNLTVSRSDGTPATGLVQTHFRVYEDDREQNIDLFQAEDSPSAIALLIDNSGSMMNKLRDVTAAASFFIAASHPQDEMFIVNFNRTAWLGLPASQPFTRDRGALRSALAQTRAEGTTALYDALKLALNHLELSATARKAVVILSDGGDNASATNFDEALRCAQQSSATIYCIGIYDAAQRDRDPLVLKAISSCTGGEAFFPENLTDLHSVWPRIAATIREQYTIGYVPNSSVTDARYRKILVTAEDKQGNSMRIRMRPGYVPRQIRSIAETGNPVIDEPDQPTGESAKNECVKETDETS